MANSIGVPGITNKDLTAGAAGASTAAGLNGGPSFSQVLSSVSQNVSGVQPRLSPQSQIVAAVLDKAVSDGKITPIQQKAFLAQLEELDKKMHHGHHKHGHMHVHHQDNDSDDASTSGSPNIFSSIDATSYASLVEEEQKKLQIVSSTKVQAAFSVNDASFQSFVKVREEYVGLLENIQAAVFGSVSTPVLTSDVSVLPVSGVASGTPSSDTGSNLVSSTPTSGVSETPSIVSQQS